MAVRSNMPKTSCFAWVVRGFRCLLSGTDREELAGKTEEGNRPESLEPRKDGWPTAALSFCPEHSVVVRR